MAKQKRQASCFHTWAFSQPMTPGSWQARSVSSGVLAPPLNVGLSENWGNLSRNFCLKVQNLGLKTYFWELSGKTEILSTHNLLGRQFPAVCRKIETAWPAASLTHNVAKREPITGVEGRSPARSRGRAKQYFVFLEETFPTRRKF